MSNELRIYVQDHGFLITDHDVSTPFGTMDYSTGIAGVMASAALVSAGIDRGYVTVTTQPVDQGPRLDTAEQWADLAASEDVAEFSLHVPWPTPSIRPWYDETCSAPGLRQSPER